MATATAQLVNQQVAKQYAKVQELEAAARIGWEKADRAKLKLVKLAHMGRKTRIIIPITELRAVQITNKFREEPFKVFAPAFAKKYEFKEVPLDE